MAGILRTTFSNTFSWMKATAFCISNSWWHWSIFPRMQMTLSQHSSRWRHNGCDGVSNHQPHDCLPNCLFRRRSKKTSKLRVAGHCAGNLPVTGEFPSQKASNAGNAFIWWRHHVGPALWLAHCPWIMPCTRCGFPSQNVSFAEP